MSSDKWPELVRVPVWMKIQVHPCFPHDIRSRFIPPMIGDTPLHVAVRRGDREIVAETSDAGADVNAPAEYGHTAQAAGALA